MSKEYDEALVKFRSFIETEPVVSILGRNLYFLDRNRLVTSVSVDDSMRCGLLGKEVTLSLKPFMLADGFTEAHWLCALRVFLAQEVQHACSSDRLVQQRVKSQFAEHMKYKYGITSFTPVTVAGKVLSILEKGRINNIICARFRGYIPLVHFISFAECAAENDCTKLGGLLFALKVRALTGLKADGVDDGIFNLVDSAVLSETAAECGEKCLELLLLCDELIAESCEGIAELLEPGADEYAYSCEERTEQEGDGTDSRITAAETALPVDSIEQVLGAAKGVDGLTALTESETKEMLIGCVRELEKEKEYQKANRVDTAEGEPLSRGNAGMLSRLYPNVEFTEKYVTPNGAVLSEKTQAKALHNRLERMLRDQRQRREGERTGSVSRKNLWRVEVDDPDVFSRKSSPREYESSFCLLIDKSGSMGTGFENGESKLVTALKTAAVLEEALKGIAYTKIVAFDGGVDIVEHTVIKNYNQKELGNRCTDALRTLTPGNGNKDGYSIRSVSMELSKRREMRKILVILSDGLPSGYRGETEATADVRSAVQEARKNGIIVIPILYGSAEQDKHLEVYNRMYEKGIICASQSSVLDDFEKLLVSLIR